MKNCPFCTLPAVQEIKIIENDFAFAFPTNIPITPGHVLVVPKRCVAKYRDLTVGEHMDMDNLQERLTDALTKYFGAKGFNFAWNEGQFAGQSVPHLHLHIVPRRPGDMGIYQYDPRVFLYKPGSRENSPEAELIKVCDILKKALE